METTENIRKGKLVDEVPLWQIIDAYWQACKLARIQERAAAHTSKQNQSAIIRPMGCK